MVRWVFAIHKEDITKPDLVLLIIYLKWLQKKYNSLENGNKYKMEWNANGISCKWKQNKRLLNFYSFRPNLTGVS